MSTVAVVLLIVAAFALLVIARTVWRLVRGNDEMVAAGSLGKQFFGRREKPQEPGDWLDQ